MVSLGAVLGSEELRGSSEAVAAALPGLLTGSPDYHAVLKASGVKKLGLRQQAPYAI
jgi:hypothetical protein